MPTSSDTHAAEPAPKTGPLNIATPTLGGKQFWADQLVFRGWRIQRQTFTGHHRLLDPNNVRHAWGTFAHCRDKLDQIKTQRKLPPLTGKAVVVLHGLYRTRGSMEKLGKNLAEQGDYHLVSVGYPTTRASIDEHAQDFARVIENLGGVEQIDVVAHSLGNLVIRRYFAGDADPRIKRIVMLGPPNQGAKLAERVVPIDLTGALTGPAVGAIARDWPALEKTLATPDCQFGILAGGNGASGRNPLVPGDDDLIVSVASTRLAGARDFRVLPVWHTTMMNDATVQEMTLRFLEHGYFESDEERQPIDDPIVRNPE